MDTIFALSTPPGKSGVAVVRVSGPQASESLIALGVVPLPPARSAHLAALRLADGGVFDRALVLYFPAPRSFTGEDIAEFHIHGGRAVIAALLAVLTQLPGLRPAHPGEFTRRAYLNGKMDLTAAEGLADLIDAETEAQRRQALRFMEGQAAEFYQRLRQDVLEILALNEAYIDFPDEEIPSQVLKDAASRNEALMALIERQLADKGAAERVRDGVRVAILGPPNAGKSSLMNLLARRDVAIVSHTAGTTRDVIEVHLDIGGYAVIIADTAGLRDAKDEVEQEGIRRSLERAEAADIRIVVLDAEEIAGKSDTGNRQLATLITPDTIVVLNKTDLALPSPLPAFGGIVPIALSAVTRLGLESLLETLAACVALHSSAESSFITRSRHRRHLQRTLEHLRRYSEHADAGLELQCEELRRAAVEIGSITGVIVADEVLGQIFSRFCIGK